MHILPGASASWTPTPVGILLQSNDTAELTQPLDVNTLHNAYVVEELIQLTVGSSAKIIANSHWTEDLTADFSLEYS